MSLTRWMTLLLVVGLVACDDDDDSAPGTDAHTSATDALSEYDGALDSGITPDALVPDAAVVDPLLAGPCDLSARTGAFELTLADGYTAVQGQVMDKVRASDVFSVAAEADGCALLVPPSLNCDPACEVGEICTASGCVAEPVAVDLGTVTVSGLKAPVEMTARAPVYYYNFRGDLPHPGFEVGDALSLSAEGLSLDGVGIAALEAPEDAIPVKRGEATRLTWTAAADGAQSELFAVLSVANHGGIPARIECRAVDDGELQIPAALVDALLDIGYSGFPSVSLTRRTVDHAALGAGCVELKVQSRVVLEVSLDGVVSCSTDEDCQEGETCQANLICGL